jgi:hypothetical protein
MGMTEATDQFAELTRRGHDLFTAAVQAWDQAARSIAEAARRPEGRLPDIRASVDAAFDFAAQMLADQREFTKTLMSVGSQVVAATTERAEPAAGPAAGPATAPEALTGSDARSAPDAGTPTVESDADSTVSDGQSGSGETDAAAPKEPVPPPVPDDSAATGAPAETAATPAPTPTPVETPTPTPTPTETETPAPRKTVAKKTTARKATAAKKTAEPARTPATAAKKAVAPGKRSSPAKRATGPRDGDTA